MTHARKQIRDALASRLSGLSTTGARVFSHRYHEFNDDELPGLRVYAESDEVLGQMMGGRQHRRVQFVVEACAKVLTTLEDTLDQIALEVEAAIGAENTLGGLVKGGTNYEGIGDFNVQHEGEKPVGVWPLRFTADYDTDAATPQTIA